MVVVGSKAQRERTGLVRSLNQVRQSPSRAIQGLLPHPARRRRPPRRTGLPYGLEIFLYINYPTLELSASSTTRICDIELIYRRPTLSLGFNTAVRCLGLAHSPRYGGPACLRRL
jgi:hypothetical protein